MATAPISLKRHLRLKDPRLNRCKKHLLIDIVTIAVCAVIANANTWKQIDIFGRRRQAWFQGFLELPNGIPSKHTFERLFDRLDPQVIQRCLLGWLHEISALLGVHHIAIDGKTLRHSGGGNSPHRQLHLVSAWAAEANLTLGQVAVDEKSNEITAIPYLLELLKVSGQTSGEERYFIGSRDCSAKHYGMALRNHWTIENNLHWQLDVSFAEDASRIQKRYGGQNFALLHSLALGLLKRHPSKESIKSKRYEAALDVIFLEEVLK